MKAKDLLNEMIEDGWIPIITESPLFKWFCVDLRHPKKRPVEPIVAGGTTRAKAIKAVHIKWSLTKMSDESEQFIKDRVKALNQTRVEL